MVLDHIAKRARFLVIPSATLHTNRLCSGNLNETDVAAIPKGLEYAVPKAEGQDVLNGLFPQVVVNAVYGRFVENLMDFDVQLAGAFEVVTEWLFDNDPTPSIAFRQSMLAERLDGFGV